MTCKSNVANETALTDAELEAVAGGFGGTLLITQSPWVALARELSQAYLANHPTHLGEPLPHPR